MCWVRAILVVLLLTLLLQQSSGKEEHDCPPSSCGKIANISYPFRLKDDPQRCGDSRYELSCENNKTVLYLYSGKYHVQAINYKNFTIRLVDPGVQEDNCSSVPRYFLSRSNFCDTYQYDYNECTDPYQAVPSNYGFLFEHIVYLNCTHPVTDNPTYVDTSPCVDWHSNGYIYAIAGDLIAENFHVDCHVKLVAPTSWWGLSQIENFYPDIEGNEFSYPAIDRNEISYAFMHKALVYGFEISWLLLSCQDYCGDSSPGSCSFNTSSEKLQCDMHHSCFHFPDYENSPCGIWTQLRPYAKDNIIAIWIGLRQIIKGLPQRYDTGRYRIGLATGKVGLPSFLAARFLFGMTLFIALLIYKWRRRHLSMYESIETYLQQNNLTPIAYSYKEIKKMTRGFKDKLGEGGYGSVFKGYLRSGPCVGIKMLGKSKGNGQDFINEVATIGRMVAFMLGRYKNFLTMRKCTFYL